MACLLRRPLWPTTFRSACPRRCTTCIDVDERVSRLTPAVDRLCMTCKPGSVRAACVSIFQLGLAMSLVAACDSRPLDRTDAGGSATGFAGASGAGGAGASPGSAGAGGSAVGGAGACAAGAVGTGGRGGTLASQCTDGIDNDGDGKTDYDDPECIGGYDNDESSFAWGIPGDNIDLCKTDCFFDSNSGMGDDNCAWQLKCDPLSTEASCPYDAAYGAAHPTECSLSSSQTQICVDRCSKLVANGCDCFGCCNIPGLAGP